MEYSPDSPLIAVRTLPVATSVRLICAPGITARLGSYTVPRTAPRCVCASTDKDNNRSNKKKEIPEAIDFTTFSLRNSETGYRNSETTTAWEHYDLGIWNLVNDSHYAGSQAKVCRKADPGYWTEGAILE